MPSFLRLAALAVGAATAAISVRAQCQPATYVGFHQEVVGGALAVEVLWVLGIGYAAAGAAMLFLHFAYRSARAARILISDDPHRSVDEAKLRRDVLLNMGVAVAFITSVGLGLSRRFFYDGPVSRGVVLAEAVVVIFIYDFAYYFAHRFLMHEWTLLRGVHSVHHAARNPRTVDSLLLHPVETLVGLSLLFASVAAVGGVHVYTFAPVFVAYTTLNVLNHAGVSLPRFPFRTLSLLAVKHDKHHHSMLSGNYASITPLPDVVFGTVE